MPTSTVNQWLNTKQAQETHLLTQIEAFLIDRRAQNMSPGTLYYYKTKLTLFAGYCDSQAVTQITQIDANLIRGYLLHLETKGYNPGGCHQGFKTLKTFLRWWQTEYEPDDWSNPIQKVKAPKIAVEPLDPVALVAIKTLLEACPKDTFMGARDQAIIYCLLDTGARASEFVNIDLEDFNPVSGEILIRQGKGRKPRNVYLGQKSKKAVRKYTKQRNDNCNALWVSDEGEKLTYWGLNEIIRRRAKEAGIEKPELHAFRRQFALSCLRAGMDVYSLQSLMGHADLQVLRRYLKQTNQDLVNAHRQAGPVDNAL